jgi:transposase
MIQLTAHMRILVCTTPLDMRKGIDGIGAYCRQILGENPMSGAAFMFISRSRKLLRVLVYDGQGFWLCTKRLSSGRFPHWPEAKTGDRWLKELESCEAVSLLHGGDPRQIKPILPWKKILSTSSFSAGVA